MTGRGRIPNVRCVLGIAPIAKFRAPNRPYLDLTRFRRPIGLLVLTTFQLLVTQGDDLYEGTLYQRRM
jgi:hypothetical protein